MKLSLLTILLLLLSGIVETLYVASIYPLLQTITKSIGNQNTSYSLDVLSAFNLSIPFDIKFSVIVFTLFAVTSACLRLYSLWLTEKTTALIGNDLSSLAFRSSLYRSYSWLNNYHSSELVSSLSTDINQVLTGILLPVFLTINSLAVLVGIVLTIVIIDWKIFVLLISVILLIYSFILLIAIPHTKAQGSIRVLLTKKLYKTMLESLSGIVQVKSFEIEDDMSNIFKQTDFRLRKSIAKVNFLSQFPKITVETVVILTIIAGSLILFDSDLNSSRIAVLGLIAFGSQKLIPVCQLLYFNFIKIYNSRANLSNYLSYLVSEACAEFSSSSVPFFVSQSQSSDFLTIKASQLYYQYPNSKFYALDNINFSLSPGELILLQGSSGAGKSTLIKNTAWNDFAFGGKSSITDGLSTCTFSDEYNFRYLRKIISYVPQHVNLFDTSLLRNITLILTVAKILIMSLSRNTPLFSAF